MCLVKPFGAKCYMHNLELDPDTRISKVPGKEPTENKMPLVTLGMLIPMTGRHRASMFMKGSKTGSEKN